MKRALTRVGVAALKRLVIEQSSAHVFVPTTPAEAGQWLHFIQVAIACEQLAQNFKALGIDRNKAYLAGLLHDVGRLDYPR